MDPLKNIIDHDVLKGLLADHSEEDGPRRMIPKSLKEGEYNKQLSNIR